MSRETIILAVTGSVAAYKAAALCSELVQLGHAVDVILTGGALRFITPTTFNALTRRPVHTSAWEPWTEEHAGHVSLARNARAVIVAPASASAISRLAHGSANDLLGLVALSTNAPLVIAPAMEDQMWRHPATRANIALLVDRGATICEPECGRLASGAIGQGRLASTSTILGALASVIGSTGPLAGVNVVVTAGGTQEAIDPVRFVGNRSSGQMGFALSLAFRDLGAHVQLIAGPTILPPPAGVTVTLVESALEMKHAVDEAVADARVLVMAAAVADFRPLTTSVEKIKKQPGQGEWTLHLIRNPDILAETVKPDLIKVGFAAETSNLLTHAKRKLTDKGLDLLIANDAVATIGQPESQAFLLRPNEEPETLPLMPKVALAKIIAQRVVELIARQDATGTTA